MRLHGSDPHTLAGGYAMDAVPDSDRSRFERHLAGCEACRQEIRGLREATARLAAATAVQPPAALKEATLRAVARTRQLSPASSEDTTARRALRWWPGHRLRPATRLRLAVALAVALAAGVVIGVLAPGGRHLMDRAELRDHAIAAVLDAPDATMLTAQVSTGGTATVVMSHRERALVFMAAHLRALPAGEGYELWLMRPGGARPAGMLPLPSRDGMVGPMVVSGLGAGDSVDLTVEPAGGAPRPTASPVLTLRLAP
jgi:anti-sigma-K factor RskA